MKILFASTSSNNTHTVIGSAMAAGHNVEVLRYDERWHEQVGMAIQQDPSVRDRLQAGQFHLGPERVSMDAKLLDMAKSGGYDVIIYVSAWEGDFVPTNETLGALNKIAPVVHMCFDAADPPWWPQLKKFEEDGTFSLTLSIDGAYFWPGSKAWNGDWKVSKALTLLTPLDPTPFAVHPMPFQERPYPVAYAGNAGGWVRSYLVDQLQRHVKGFAFRQRDDHPNSYQLFADFMKYARVIVSVPFTGSGVAKHVKGRVLEAAMAGACLLEWRNDATRSFFEPRRDFWEYGSVDECVEMALWLSTHPKIAEEMAANLHRRVRDEHNANVFWQRVFNALI